MQSNAKVMKFVRAKKMTYQENKKDLKNVIEKYDLVDNNNFWIYAVERMYDNAFVGTVAFVKYDTENEIGYRFLEKYWGKGYGTEIVNGMVLHAKKLQLPSLVAYVSPKNIGSETIIKNLGFTFVKSVICKDLNIPENKYILKL